MYKKLDSRRRLLAKYIAISPLLGFFPEKSFSNLVMDVDLKIAEQYWSLFVQSINATEEEKRKIPFVPRHEDPLAEKALYEIGKPIMATSTRQNIAWRIGLVKNGVVNAVTPGGGVIFVFDGLIALCESEAELASIIAHEVGHIEHRHAIQRYYAMKVFEQYGINPNADSATLKHYFEENKFNVIADKIVYKSYTRLWEHQADAFIIRSFNKLDYALSDSYLFFERLMKYFGSGSPDLCIYNSHPLTQERVLRLKNLSKVYRKRKSKPDSDAFRYLKSVVGHINV